MSCAGSNQKPKHNVKTAKSESNGAYLHKRGPVVEATWELLPHLLREETGTVWYPERGVWYTAERSGTVGAAGVVAEAELGATQAFRCLREISFA